MPVRLAVVRAVAATLGAAHTESEVADAVLHAVSHHLGCVTASLWLVSSDGTELVLEYERNADPGAIARFGRMPLTSDLPGPQVVRTGEPFFVRSRQERDELWPVVAGTPSPSEALAVLPLASSDAALGVVSFGFAEVRSFDDQDRTALLAIADQCAIALDRARLYETLRVDVEHNDILARLATAGGRAGVAEVARGVTDIVAEGFVDSCAIYLREGNLVRRVAASSRSHHELLERLGNRFPTALNAPSAHATAIRENRPVEVGSIADAMVAIGGGSAEYQALVADLSIGEAWAFPLVDGARAFGSMLFVTGPGEDLTRSQLHLARQVADRTAAMVRSARQFSEHQSALEAVREVLVPPELPAVEGFTLAACYVPVAQGLGFGGDWWDVLPLPEDRVAFSVGDVVGHGVNAVAVMGQLRNALRGHLVAGATPAQALEAVSALLAWTHPDAHATAVVFVVEATGRLRWSAAGHPPPLVVGADGEARQLTSKPQPPLGIAVGGPRLDHESAVHAGETLCLYTDGLVERRGVPIDEGIERLATIAGSAAHDLGFQLRCEMIVAALVDDQEDDVCLLLARRD